MNLKVNGTSHALTLDPRTTMLDLVREHLDLTGTKKGCDQGQCGACTVLIDGRRVNLLPDIRGHVRTARDHHDRRAGCQDGALHPLQQAFIDHDAFQCGYCTPGQICSAAGLIAEGKAKTAEEIRELMSGNICRCGAYTNIVAAIQQAMGRVMIDFQYARATDVADAVRQIAGNPRREVRRRRHQSDRSDEDGRRTAGEADRHHAAAAEARSKTPPDGGLRIGALVRNSDLAYHPLIEQRYPVLVKRASWPGASQQLRNMATTGGNLLQRTRCAYFYDIATPCNKREPGSGCSAIGGLNRMNAILGTSDACIAVHPSDMCVALAVLEAKVHVTGPARRARASPLRTFIGCRATRRSATPTSMPDELITAIELPPQGFAAQLHLPEDPRPAVLCVRAGLGRGRRSSSTAAPSRRRASRSAASRTSRGAIRAAEAALAAASPPTRQLRPGGGCRCCAMPRASGTTPSRSIWRAAAIVRALTQAARGTPQSQSNKKIA